MSGILGSAHQSAQQPKSEEEELAELQGMIGGVPRGMYIKLQQAQKNRDFADQVRKEKEELKVLQEQRAAEQKDRIDRLRAKREQKQEAAKLAHKNKVKQIGEETRQEVKNLEAARDAQKAEHWREARVRVEHANNLDARLDASEAAQDQREREDAAAARAKFKAELDKQRADEAAHKNYLNTKVRTIHERAKQGHQNHLQTKRERKQATQADVRQWESIANQKKQDHLNHSRNMQQKRAAEREEARKRNEERANARREAAREEKANNAVATEAIANEVRKNQLMRARSYARRYVPTEEVETLEASDTFRRLYGLTDANGEIKTVTRADLGK